MKISAIEPFPVTGLGLGVTLNWAAIERHRSGA
jgi:hypothetical protein